MTEAQLEPAGHATQAAPDEYVPGTHGSGASV